MKELNNLFESISKLKAKYDIERGKDRFNIITALHKEYDEKNLHSRFISYLVSPVSGHDMDTVYLKLFISHVLKIEKFDTSSITVLPNEADKSEYENIDILITNNNNQAVIIENKIRAPDSNNNTYNLGFQGQLERYYNTIKKGVNKNGNDCSEYKRKNIYVYYLSPEGAEPTEFSVGMLKDKPESWRENSIISYANHIRAWLESCIEKTPEDKILIKELIYHYLKLINKMTNNDLSKDEAIELKKAIAENTQSVKYLFDNFKHVKWHTVHEFWTEVKKQLMENDYQNVVLYPDGKEFNDVITEITHKNKDINHGALFDFKNGLSAYISGKGNLSWGVESLEKWEWFEGETIDDINFSKFNTKCTYQLIDRGNMEDAVKEIIKEIAKEVNELAASRLETK